MQDQTYPPPSSEPDSAPVALPTSDATVITGVFEFHITVQTPPSTSPAASNAFTPQSSSHYFATGRLEVAGPPTSNPPTPSSSPDPNTFHQQLEDFCQSHGLKLTVIHLSSGKFPEQVMVGRYIAGRSDTIAQAVTETYLKPLQEAGFHAVRVKIESLASNKGVPQDAASKSERYPQAYFEFHWKVALDPSRLPELNTLVRKWSSVPGPDSHTQASPAGLMSLHLSRNAYKKLSTHLHHVFLTGRVHKEGKQVALQKHAIVSELLSKEGFKAVKAEREFVLVDTNFALDDGWFDPPKIKCNPQNKCKPQRIPPVLDQPLITGVPSPANETVLEKTVKLTSPDSAIGLGPTEVASLRWSKYADLYAAWDTRSTLPFALDALDLINLPQRLDRLAQQAAAAPRPDDFEFATSMDAGGAKRDELMNIRRLEILDVAAGTGGFGIEAIKRGGRERVRVVATDLAERMVKLVAISAAEALGKDVATECLIAATMNGQALELPDESVDVAACIFGVFLMDDGFECISEMYRVLRPGGVCVLTTWQDTFLQSLALDALEKVDAAAAEHFRTSTPPLKPKKWEDGNWIADRMLTQIGFATAKATRSTHVLTLQPHEFRPFATYLAGGPGVWGFLSRMGWPGAKSIGEIGAEASEEVMNGFVQAVTDVLNERFAMKGVIELFATANLVMGIRS
ncbi:hypothetical protein HDU96_006584 [Phlyctochytrium bullatum]|nr:hypothetical protein HDU96_006584 [Phlyctochytrium bullatum]